MSDLISRSELIKHFEAIQQQENVVGLEFIAMIDEIKEQPTAYDVDKVVEELEDCSWSLEAKILVPNGNELGEYEEAERKMICIQDAIEIIKQGGVSSEDLCEYRRQLEGYNSLFITSCCHIYKVGNDFKFCPNCGKRIKVVE